jgi:hypothetical protein
MPLKMLWRSLNLAELMASLERYTVPGTSTIMSLRWKLTCEPLVTVSICIHTLLVGTLKRLTGLRSRNITQWGIRAKREFVRSLGVRKTFLFMRTRYRVNAANGNSKVRDLRNHYIIHYDLYANLKQYIQFIVVIVWSFKQLSSALVGLNTSEAMRSGPRAVVSCSPESSGLLREHVTRKHNRLSALFHHFKYTKSSIALAYSIQWGLLVFQTFCNSVSCQIQGFPALPATAVTLAETV